MADPNRQDVLAMVFWELLKGASLAFVAISVLTLTIAMGEHLLHRIRHLILGAFLPNAPAESYNESKTTDRR